jgi:hypothetical protein
MQKQQAGPKASGAKSAKKAGGGNKPSAAAAAAAAAAVAGHAGAGARTHSSPAGGGRQQGTPRHDAEDPQVAAQRSAFLEGQRALRMNFLNQMQQRDKQQQQGKVSDSIAGAVDWPTMRLVTQKWPPIAQVQVQQPQQQQYQGQQGHPQQQTSQMLGMSQGVPGFQNFAQQQQQSQIQMRIQMQQQMQQQQQQIGLGHSQQAQGYGGSSGAFPAAGHLASANSMPGAHAMQQGMRGVGAQQGFMSSAPSQLSDASAMRGAMSNPAGQATMQSMAGMLSQQASSASLLSMHQRQASHAMHSQASQAGLPGGLTMEQQQQQRYQMQQQQQQRMQQQLQPGPGSGLIPTPGMGPVGTAGGTMIPTPSSATQPQHGYMQQHTSAWGAAARQPGLGGAPQSALPAVSANADLVSVQGAGSRLSFTWSACRPALGPVAPLCSRVCQAGALPVVDTCMPRRSPRPLGVLTAAAPLRCPAGHGADAPGYTQTLRGQQLLPISR